MLRKGGRRIVRRNEVPGLAVPAVDVSKLGVTDAGSLFQHGREHRLKIAGRAADNLSTSEVAVCCSNASPRSVVRWRSSLSNRAFSMAMTAWAANYFANSI